jgi:hypothetical protein
LGQFQNHPRGVVACIEGLFSKSANHCESLRSRAAPTVMGKPEVEVTQAACDGDRAEIGAICEPGSPGFQPIEGGIHLRQLGLRPGIPTQLLRPDSGLVTREERRIQQPVREGLLRQRPPAAFARAQEPTWTEGIQVFTNYAAVIDDTAVVGEERGTCPNGLCATISWSRLIGCAAHDNSSIRSASPSSWALTSTFRTKGEAGE